MFIVDEMMVMLRVDIDGNMVILFDLRNEVVEERERRMVMGMSEGEV